MTDPRPVLDKGYVKLLDSLGDDLTTVNAARASFAKESGEFGPADETLLRFLIREGHMSPFRHAALSFEVYAPLMVARQWWKYVVASTHLDDQNGWNESSRRYVTEIPEFYIPGAEDWRGAPENKKQGSFGKVSGATGFQMTKDLQEFCDRGLELYDRAIEDGVATEQARLFLPAYGLYVRWRWTASLPAVLHFLQERLDHSAQKEIYLYAVEVENIVKETFPFCFKALRDLSRG